MPFQLLKTGRLRLPFTKRETRLLDGHGEACLSTIRQFN
jgi:hypothetical protein